MTIEASDTSTTVYLNSLNPAYPGSADAKSEGDNHMRLTKRTLVNSFPAITGPVTSTHTELNKLDGVTVGATEFNYLTGITSNVQQQLNTKLVSNPSTSVTFGNGLAVTGTGTSANYFGPKACSIYNALGEAPLETRGSGAVNNSALIQFHQPNLYGVKLGLHSQSDSHYFMLGGWSYGATYAWYVNLISSPGTMYCAGNFTAGGNITAYSDPRLKENIVPIDNAIDKLSKLDGVSFNWKNDTDIQTITRPGAADYGVLSTQVKEVFPYAVSDMTSPEGETYETVAYDKLIPALIQAIKELKQEIQGSQGLLTMTSYTPASGAISMTAICNALEQGNSAYLNLAAYRGRRYFISGTFTTRLISQSPSFAEFYGLWRPTNMWMILNATGGTSGSGYLANGQSYTLYMAGGGGSGGGGTQSFSYCYQGSGGGGGGRRIESLSAYAGQSYSYTVGAAAGASLPGGNGYVGGTSSISTNGTVRFTATGGGAGTSAFNTTGSGGAAGSPGGTTGGVVSSCSWECSSAWSCMANAPGGVGWAFIGPDGVYRSEFGRGGAGDAATCSVTTKASSGYTGTAGVVGIWIGS